MRSDGGECDGSCRAVAGLCGHHKGREELVQLLVDVLEDILQCRKDILSRFGWFMAGGSGGNMWGRGIYLGNLGVRCEGKSCCKWWHILHGWFLLDMIMEGKILAISQFWGMPGNTVWELVLKWGPWGGDWE